MSPSAAFFLVLLAMIFGFVIVMRWFSHRTKHERRDRRDQRNEDIDRELAELRERVKTLERIVTDDRYRLDREFDSLETSARRSG